MNITISVNFLILLLLFEYVKAHIDNNETSLSATTTINQNHNDNVNIVASALNLEAVNITSYHNTTIKHYTNTNSTNNNSNTDDKIRPILLTRRRKFKVHNANTSNRPTLIEIALQNAAKKGLDAMVKLYDTIEPEILRRGNLLEDNHPAALLSKFSAPLDDMENEMSAKAAFATLMATKSFQKSYKRPTEDLGRQASTSKISFRRTALEGLCPQRELPVCLPAAQRYRTHDGTCNNRRRPRWGSAQMPFNRFMPPQYGDDVDTIRGSVDGGALSSSRFVSLLVHGARSGDAPVTLILAQWGQLIDHDLTSTAQPKAINGSIPRCCGPNDFHPSCFPIKVPQDDPWLSPLKVRCLEFLRSAPAQRRDCVLSWREQTNQVTSYLDASPVYSSNARNSDNARVFRHGLLLYGRGNPLDDVCLKGAIGTQCIRAGDARSGEQPGLMALHHVWVGEHNRIAAELNAFNPHWSDEKVYQETRRIVGALFQHITYREFLPLVLGREVGRLFDLELLSSGFYTGYDSHVNPTVANSFAAAAFRFGHSLVQGSYLRCDRHHNFINNNVTLHEEFARGDIGSAGSLHRLLRGMAAQRALKRDEFISAELTNHLFQSGDFPFGLDLAAINIQRGRDHGIPAYTSWRSPCGLSTINNWEDMLNIVGPESTQRIRHAYASVHDIDLFVGGIAERPVVGGLVGPTFACIIAQQFSNLRRGDRFWYENSGFESSFTPAQLHSIRRVSLAQILCRTTNGGTLQPHIFIPHEADGNQRLPCGFGSLAPMDLSPWLEQDPFKSAHQDKRKEILPSTTNKPAEHQTETVTNGIAINTTSSMLVNRIDFIPNGSTGFRRPPQSTNIHDKLDFMHKFSTKRPLAAAIKPTVSNKLDTKKNRKPAITPHPTKRTSTKRTVIVNNIPIELGRTASTLSPKIPVRPNTINLTDTTTPVSTRTKRDDKKMAREIFFLSVNNQTAATTTLTSDTFHTTKDLQFITNTTTGHPLELRNYYDQDITFNRPPQSIRIDGLTHQEYDIEINIRQANKNNKKPQSSVPIFNYDHNNNKPYGIDRTDVSPPIRNDFIDIPTPSSPFSHRPKPTKPNYETLYELHNNFASTSTTKPPKIIYINDEHGYRPTTARPGFIQSLFSFGGGSSSSSSTTNKVLNHQQFDNERADFIPQPNRGGSNSIYNINHGGGGSSLISGISTGHHANNIDHINNKHKPSTAFSINIRPSAPSLSDLSGYPSINPRPGLGNDPVRNQKPHFVTNSYNEYQNGPQHSISSSLPTTSFYEPQYPLYHTTTRRQSYHYQQPNHQYETTTPRRSHIYDYDMTTTRRPTPLYFNQVQNTYDQSDYRPSSADYRPSKYRPSDYRLKITSDISHVPEHDTELGRSELIKTTSTTDNNTITGHQQNISNSNQDANVTDTSDNDYEYYDETDISTDNDDINTKFDKDGYLRPEHMFFDGFSTITDTNLTQTQTFDDNFVMPKLTMRKNQSSTLTRPLNTDTNNSTTNLTTINDTNVYNDAIPRQPFNDISADDYDNLSSAGTLLNITRQQFKLQKQTPLILNKTDVKLFPINILTKPERPDNWVIFDKFDEKPPLPELPELKNEQSFSTREFPKPIKRSKKILFEL